MLRLVLVWAVVLGGLTPVAPARTSAMEMLESLGRSLRRHPVWTAAYDQEYVAAGMTEGEQLSGRVWVAWPDRAHFVTGAPPVQLMGLEGRTVRLVDLEAGSCDHHELSDDEWARIPLAAVLEPGRALDLFAVLDNGDRGFALVPRDPGGVDRVEVTLDSDGLPAEVVVVDPQGAVNRLTFSGWASTSEPPDGGWLPAPPEGVDCVTD